MSVKADRKVSPPERVVLTTTSRRLKSELSTDGTQAGVKLCGIGDYRGEGDTFASVPIDELIEWCQLTLEMLKARAH